MLDFSVSWESIFSLVHLPWISAVPAEGQGCKSARTALEEQLSGCNVKS